MIDHTLAFRRYDDLLNPTAIINCEQDFRERLQGLEEKTVKGKLKKFIPSHEITPILKRRDKLVEHIQDMIESRGEGVVLFTFE